tara:strand:- start:52 stop:1044 length:993 start_codon:yes stop_codon:yes gene_type:complete
MISKSYQIENNNKFFLDNNCILFYGDNLGLRRDFKKIIKKLNQKFLIVDLDQEQILKDINIFITELTNLSLFSEKKIIFIENTTDKILKILEEYEEKILDNKVILFADILDKKSKLRNYFEKSSKLQTVACYPDNEISLKKIISNRLNGFQNLSHENVRLILEKSNLDRIKLYNEIDKILIFFQNKILDKKKLEILLDANINENFNTLKDEALLGNKINTNRLLSDTNLEDEKGAYYISVINQRLMKLKEIRDNSTNSDLESALNAIRPPIFWKDKHNVLLQLKRWNQKKIKIILNLTFETEKRIKSNFFGNKDILLKKLIVDICEHANA